MDYHAHTDPQWPDDSSKWEPLFTADCKALSDGDCADCENLDGFQGYLSKVAGHTANFGNAMFPS